MRVNKLTDREVVDQLKHQKTLKSELENDEADIEHLAEVNAYIELLEEERKRRKL